MELRRQLHIIRSRLPILLISVVLAGGIAFIATSLMPRVYEARATLLVGQSLSAVNPDYNALLTSQRLTATYASIATRRPILDAVIAKLNLDMTAGQLAGKVYAELSQTTAFLTIIARDLAPEGAAAIANEVAAQVIAASPTISGQQVDLLAAVETDLKATRADIDSTRAEIESLQAITDPTAQDRADLLALQNRLASLRSTYATLLSFSSTNASNLLTLVEPAVPPTSAAAPNRTLTTLLAAAVGLLLATAIVFVVEYLDDSLKRPEDVEEASGLPTLGTISRLKGERGRSEIYRLVTLLNPRSTAAEAYRSLRTNVDFASVDTPLRTLLVSSAASSEGKTVTAANLAVVFAQAGRRVLLVDADLRRPGVNQIFDVPNSQGLTTLFLHDTLDHERITLATEQANLRLLTTGPLPPNPAELVGSQRMTAILETLGAAYDLLILDSPPLGAVADAAILAARVDGTLLVVQAGRSRRQSVVRARDMLSRAGVRVVGVVLNRVSAGGDTDYYAAYGTKKQSDLDAAEGVGGG